MARPEALLPMVEYPDTPKDPAKPNEGVPINVPSDQALTADEKAQLSELTGWQSDWKALQEWWGDHQKGSAPWELLLQHLFGWILTAVAISMGAPFWFGSDGKAIGKRCKSGGATTRKVPHHGNSFCSTCSVGSLPRWRSRWVRHSG